QRPFLWNGLPPNRRRGGFGGASGGRRIHRIRRRAGKCAQAPGAARAERLALAPPTTMKFDRSLFIAKFAEEAKEHLQKLGEGLLALEKNPDDLDTTKVILRSAHTLK